MVTRYREGVPSKSGYQVLEGVPGKSNDWVPGGTSKKGYPGKYLLG